MKKGKVENADSQRIIRRTSSQEIEIAFLTGRVVQFVENVARNAGVPSDLLAQRVLFQLGNSEVRQSSGPEKAVSPLPENGSEGNSTTRKMALGRRPRRHLSKKTLKKIQLAFKKGASINSLAEKYRVSWKKAQASAVPGSNEL